ncbi:MAG: porin family protein [Acidobacteriota bacterium]|jgi:opacity protein-like surface antigen|nr:porin family protein [Acidobacteriota bacterium]
MKKLVLVLVLLLGVSTAASAQDVAVADLFAGYSFNRCVSEATECDLNGWNAALDFNVNNNWAITVDVSGYYGTFDDVAPYNGLDVKSHNFLFGPKYTFGSSERVRPYVHALFGINHINPASPATVENNFAQAYGGGVDVRLNDKVFVRAVQVDYLGIRREGFKAEDNIRFSAGFVFRLGQK